LAMRLSLGFFKAARRGAVFPAAKGKVDGSLSVPEKRVDRRKSPG
jgi:hypothetical protein